MPNLSVYFKTGEDEWNHYPGPNGVSIKKQTVVVTGFTPPPFSVPITEIEWDDYNTVTNESTIEWFESIDTVWSGEPTYYMTNGSLGTYRFSFPTNPGYTRTYTYKGYIQFTYQYSIYIASSATYIDAWTNEDNHVDNNDTVTDEYWYWTAQTDKWDQLYFTYTDTANYYDVTWDLNDGTESGDKTTNAAYGSGITRPTVTKIGHTLSWSGNTTVLAETGDDANKQTANWSINSYNITWNPNNGSGTFTTSQEYESQIDTPSGHNEPTWDGYTFNGWTGPDTVGTSGNNRTANWKPKMTLTIGTQSKTLYPNEDTSIVPTIQRLGYTGVWINGTSKLDQGVIIPVLYTTPLTFQIEWTSSEEVSLQNAKKQLNPVNPGEADSNISLKNLQETVNRTSLRKLQERIKIQNWNIADVEYLDVP